MESSTAQNPYDEVLYPGYPFAQAHPDRLGAMARLFGMNPAPVEACRVLELGCGDGGNLIPMAVGYGPTILNAPIQWFILFNEIGKDTTLNSPANFPFGGNTDGNASESTAVAVNPGLLPSCLSAFRKSLPVPAIELATEYHARFRDLCDHPHIWHDGDGDLLVYLLQ